MLENKIVFIINPRNHIGNTNRLEHSSLQNCAICLTKDNAFILAAKISSFINKLDTLNIGCVIIWKNEEGFPPLLLVGNNQDLWNRTIFSYIWQTVSLHSNGSRFELG